jgi:hypothetical protein
MEALAALECVNKVWTHSEISAFIDIICLDDNATTKAYLHHSFADLDTLLMPRPTDSKGRPKKLKNKTRGNYQGTTQQSSSLLTYVTEYVRLEQPYGRC